MKRKWRVPKNRKRPDKAAITPEFGVLAMREYANPTPPRLDNLGHEELAEFATGAVRSKQADKIRWDLMPWAALKEVARVYTWGAKKYADRNWEKGIPKGRMFASGMRHYIDEWLGEVQDPEAGIHHLAHAAWNILCDLEFALRGRKDLDDRPREGMVMAPITVGSFGPVPIVPFDWKEFAQQELVRIKAEEKAEKERLRLHRITHLHGVQRRMTQTRKPTKPKRAAKGKRTRKGLQKGRGFQKRIRKARRGR